MRRRVFAGSLVAITGLASCAADAKGSGVNLLFDGDSISAGVGAPGGHGLDSQVAAALDHGIQPINVAAGGRPVRDCLQLYPQLVAPHYQRGAAANIIAFHAGDNDINQGHNAQETYQAFTDYVAMAHRQGWKVVVSTELRRYGFPPEREALLEDYNNRLRRNTAHADAVVDLDKEPRFVETKVRTDPAVFSNDGVHPSESGYAILAKMLVPAIRRVAGSALRP